MSASNSIPPNNLLMLGAIGIGAYWFLTRRAGAAGLAIPVATPQNPNPSAVNAGVIGSLLGSVTRLFGGSSAPSSAAMQQSAAVGASNAISDANYAGANWGALSSSAVDGVAYNPTNSAPYDAVNTGTATGADLSLFY